jgi:hypothetical protein
MVFSVFMILLEFAFAAPMALPTQSWAKFMSYFLPHISGLFILGLYSFLARKGIWTDKIYGLWFSVSALLGLYIAVVKFYFLRFFFLTDYLIFFFITIIIIGFLLMIMRIKAFKIDLHSVLLIAFFTLMLVYSLIYFGKS